jgi:hypothetical protein
MSTVSSLHNRRIPPMAQGASTLVWVPIGQGVVLSESAALSASVERDADSGHVHLVLRVHYRDGSTLRADYPEDLAHLTTDAVVRRVDSDALGTQRVLLEIGDMVAYPQLRANVA